jgi:methyl-accepting chemotaxis protein
MKDQMPLGRKLILLMSAMLLAALTLSIASLMFVSSLGEGLRTATGATSERLLLVGEYRTATDEMLSLERGIVAGVAAGDRTTVLKHEGDYQKSRKAAHESLARLREHLTSDAGRRLADRANAVLGTWAGAHQRLLGLTWANKDAKEVGAHLEAEITPLMAEADLVSEELTHQQEQLLADSASKAESDISRSWSVGIGLSIVSLLIGGIGLVVVRRATSQLRGITKELASGATQVASASRQISDASQSQATGASQQAAALEETSSASEEVNATSRENAASARQAAEATSQVRRSLQDVAKIMTEALEAMGRINHSSTRISAILKVIDEIAFQTNILALNASVEAARAGEAGLGFAVVADEVRSLAQRCAQAAKDTSGLVDDSIASAGDGKHKLDVLAASVTSMTAAADSVQSLAAAVLEGSVQQAQGMEQISRTVHEMQRTTQGSAASAEEGASAGEELSAQASQLSSLVESLSAIVGV